MAQAVGRRVQQHRVGRARLQIEPGRAGRTAAADGPHLDAVEIGQLGRRYGEVAGLGALVLEERRARDHLLHRPVRLLRLCGVSRGGAHAGPIIYWRAFLPGRV